MIGMAMGNQRTFDWSDRINIEIARWAVEAFFRGSEQLIGTHGTMLARCRGIFILATAVFEAGRK